MADHRDGPVTHERPPDEAIGFDWVFHDGRGPSEVTPDGVATFNGQILWNGNWTPPPVGDVLLPSTPDVLLL